MDKLFIYGGLALLGLMLKNKSKAVEPASYSTQDEAMMPSTSVSEKVAYQEAPVVSTPAPVMTLPADVTPAATAQAPAPVAVVPLPPVPAPAPIEDPRIAKRILVAQKYGADPLQLDLDQPEIQFWDGAAGVIRYQPNFIYKANQIFLPTATPQPVAPTALYPTSLSSKVQPNTVVIQPTYF